MSLHCRIRPANPNDAARLKEMNLAFNEYEVSAESIAEKLEQPSPEVVLVAESEISVVGFATAQIQSSICYDELWAEHVELYVEPEARRQGVGRALIEGIEETLKARNVKALFLRTNRRNVTAQALYQVCGLVVMSDVVFEKSLGRDE